MNLYDEFFSIIQEFEENEITYAVIGGFALAFHDKPRFTEDIDILVKSTDLEKANQRLDKLSFFKSTDPHKFLDTKLVLHRYVKTLAENYLILDLLTAKKIKIEHILENTVAYNWENGKVEVISIEDLIYLKSLRNSEQDKVDIKNLKDHEKKDGD